MFNSLKYLCSFLILLVLITPCHSAGKQDAGIRVDAVQGCFNISNTSLRMEIARFARFKGTIINRTGLIWTRLALAVTLRDKEGNVLMAPNGVPFLVPVIWDANGILGHLGSKDGCLLQITSEDTAIEATGFDIKYGAGEYKVAYGLRLKNACNAHERALRYKDSIMDILFEFTSQFIHFTLLNRSGGNLRIVWEKSGYIDADGKRHRVMHEGIPFANKDQRQEPTDIEPYGTISDIAFPVDNIVSAQHNSTDAIRPLLPAGPDATTLKGKVIGLDLAVKINQSFKSYHFSFLIDKITPITAH
jgi:hypothetical protein